MLHKYIKNSMFENECILNLLRKTFGNFSNHSMDYKILYQSALFLYPESIRETSEDTPLRFEYT